MKSYIYKKHWKFVLLFVAIIIGTFSLRYTNKLVKKMAQEERKKMEIWAEAIKYLAKPEEDGSDIFYLNISSSNTTIPVILCDSMNNIISVMNVNPSKQDDLEYLQKLRVKMKEHHEPIIIHFLENDVNIIYYDDSTILKQLAIYPYVQLGVISIFIIVAYFAFSASRKAEQNQVWVGMSKETAHQLGTPISSLMAWLEILDQSDVNHDYVIEMQKDILRLQTITERFSKIGSVPELPLSDLTTTLELAVKYMQSRTSANIDIHYSLGTSADIILPLSKPLFNWVIENLIKNAVDAMNGKGEIRLTLSESDKEAIIRVSDTGKGIPKSQQKTIFKPGFTSKERGWGLGLSLSRRIIEQYHNGKILVESSEINQGTTFKIILPK